MYNISVHTKLYNTVSDVKNMQKAGERTVTCFMEYDKENQIHTGYCPSMPPVKFSSKDENKVVELVKDAIGVYLKRYPDYFDKARTLKI